MDLVVLSVVGHMSIPDGIELCLAAAKFHEIHELSGFSQGEEGDAAPRVQFPRQQLMCHLFVFLITAIQHFASDRFVLPSKIHFIQIP